MIVLLAIFSILMTSDAYCGFDEGVSADKKGDYKTAYEEFKPLAEQGEARAQSYLGSMYLSGEGVPKNYVEAVKWFRKAVEPRGWLGIDMRTITPDLAQILGSAAAKGVIVADVVPDGPAEKGGIRRGDIIKRINEKQVENPDQLSLSMATLSPGTPATVDVIRDGKLESFNFNIGARSFVAAQFGLASMYFNGWGVPKDYAEALQWFQKAAEQGYAEAQVNLGGMYFNGQGVEQDYAEAVKWFQKAADQGDTNAQNNLGVMYSKGQGVPKDYVEAVKWFQKAAKLGYAEAQYNLGLAFANGQGVPRNDAEALAWYRKAADQGDAEAQNKLKLYASRSTDNGSALQGMASGSDFVNLLPESKDIRISTRMSEYCESYRVYKKRMIPDSRLGSFPALKGRGISDSPRETTLYIEFLSKESATKFLQCLDGPWGRHIPKFAEIFMHQDNTWQGTRGFNNWFPQHVALYDKDGDFIPLLNAQNSEGGFLFVFQDKNKPFPWQDQRIYDRLDKLGKDCPGR
ncbi:MAG: PDZ domain-containing protein [Syntrophobacteraceae bacterium]|jgi:TPR repeat protein